MEWLEHRLYGITLLDWGVVVFITCTLTFVFDLLRRFIVNRVKSTGSATGKISITAAADVIKRTRLLFLLLLAMYIALNYFEMPPKLDKIATRVIIIALILQIALWANYGIYLWRNLYIEARRETDAASATTVGILGFILRLLLWTLIILLILDNLGINITTLVAGLGVGGVAVALALQNILGDIFASLSIALDKPFMIGDFLVIDEHVGTVEYIGLKTTRLRSLSGEQIIFANNDLLKSRIRNYKRMYERRVVFHFGVIYQTSADKLERIPGMIRSIIEAQQEVRFDRAHFQKYGDSSLDFEVVYYVKGPDYNLYMDIQQAINLAMFRQFTIEKIEFAYPTRTVFMANSTV